MKYPRLSILLAVATTAVSMLAASAPSATAGVLPAHHAASSHTTGAVFVQTNDLGHNAVIAYDRGSDGRLTRMGTYSTGGAGAVEDGAVVDPLASQGSLTLDRRHGLLYAVNGGSDTITVFGVHGSRLTRRQVLPTRGDLPVSVSVAGSLVYVLNARGGGSITGFKVVRGRLVPMPGSTRSLNLTPNANPEFLQAPSQVAITPDQRAVIVATKTHGTLLVFPLQGGRPSASPMMTPSGAVPFALSFDKAGHLLVVDASGLASSYQVSRSGDLRLLSSVGPTGEQAACWSVVVKGRLYVANAGSNSISSFGVHHGTLSLLDATEAATDGGPIDMAASRDGRFVYQLSGAAGTVDEFRVAGDGSLVRIGSATTGLGSDNGHPLEGIAAS